MRPIATPIVAYHALIGLVLLASCSPTATTTPVPRRDDCGFSSETICEMVSVGPAEVLGSAVVLASSRVVSVDPTRFNTPSGEPLEVEFDPDLLPEDIRSASIDALFDAIDEDDREALERASATADALDKDFHDNWRENNPFELGHLVELEIEPEPGVLRGPSDLARVVTFVRSGRVVVEQGMHAGCVFEHSGACRHVDPELGDTGLAVMAPFDAGQAARWYGIERCEARASAIEAETGQTAACMELHWLLPGSMEAGWRWSGGINDGVLDIERIREQVAPPGSPVSPADPAGYAGAAGPPAYEHLIEAFEAGDTAKRDEILQAWHERVRPIGPLERASLSLGAQRAYSVTERFLADLAPRLKNPDRYLVVQYSLQIEGHGPPGHEILTYFRPELPPGLLPIYDAAGFTGSVKTFMWNESASRSTRQPAAAIDEAALLSFFEARLFMPSVDAIQWRQSMVTDVFVTHSWATTRLAGGSPVRIREIAFDGHMTKARVSAPVYLEPHDVDAKELEVDTYYRLEDGVWLPDDGSTFKHGGDDD